MENANTSLFHSPEQEQRLVFFAGETPAPETPDAPPPVETGTESADAGVGIESADDAPQVVENTTRQVDADLATRLGKMRKMEETLKTEKGKEGFAAMTGIDASLAQPAIDAQQDEVTDKMLTAKEQQPTEPPSLPSESETPPATIITETHSEQPDGLNEAEDLVVPVDQNSDHVEEEAQQGGGGDDTGANGEAPPPLTEEPPPSPETDESEATEPEQTEQSDDRSSELIDAKGKTDATWAEFTDARDTYFEAQAGAKEDTEANATQKIDALLQAIDAEEGLMREVGDGKGGEQDATRWHEINGYREQALAMQQQLEALKAPQSEAAQEAQEEKTSQQASGEKTPEKNTDKQSSAQETAPEAEDDLGADFKRARELLSSDKESERDAGFVLLMETIVKWLEKRANTKKESTEGDNNEKEKKSTKETKEKSENYEVNSDELKGRLFLEMQEKDLSASELKTEKENKMRENDEHLDQRVDRLETEIDDLDDQNDKAKKELRNLEQSLADNNLPEEERFNLQQQLDDLKTDIKGREEKIERREQQRKDSLEAKKDNDEDLKKDIDTLDTMIKDLQKNVDKARETLSRIIAEGNLDANQLSIMQGIQFEGNEKTMAIDITLNEEAMATLPLVLNAAGVSMESLGLEGNKVKDLAQFFEHLLPAFDAYEKTKAPDNLGAEGDAKKYENVA